MNESTPSPPVSPSPDSFKPIETSYAGCRFRSRLEARWAVFFDSLKIDWEYEPEGYVLRDGTRYLPDFWLPQVGMFAEVKPHKGPDRNMCGFTWEDMEKCFALSVGTRNPVLMCDGTPRAVDYFTVGPLAGYVTPAEYRDLEQEWMFVHYDLLNINQYHLSENRFFSEDIDTIYVFLRHQEVEDCFGAVAKARSARFEYGESG